MESNFELVPLESIRVQKHNVRLHNIDQGLEDLAENIRANGLLQPIAAYYDSEESRYVILTGQRRLNAYHRLNERYPGGRFGKILCRVIPKPDTSEEMTSMSLAENITQLPMTDQDLVKAVTDLYNVYGDYEMVQEKFGITRNMVDKYVRLARLPDRLKTAIQDGEIHSSPRKAENVAIEAVRATGYTKNGPISEDHVLDLAKEMARQEISTRDLAAEARRGGSIQEIKERATTRVKKRFSIELDRDIADKLKKISESSGDTESNRATQYVIDGVDRDYDQLGD